MADLKKLFERCVDGARSLAIHARDVYTYTKSPFMVFCNHFAEAKERDPKNDYQELLFERGYLHEERIVKQKYPEFVEMVYTDDIEGFKRVLSLMDDGTKAIHNAPLFFLPDGLVGKIDVLVRQSSRQSVFGPYHYTVKEIKLAKNIKEHHILQAAFYNFLLGKIQGMLPDKFSVINRDGDEFEFEYAQYHEKLQHALSEVREILNGKEVTPTYGEGYWPWESYTNRLAIERDDVSLVAGVGGSTKRQLNERGILTVHDLATASLGSLQKIDGVGPQKAKQFRNSALALVRNTPVIINRKALVFPKKKLELFLDLEGTDQSLNEAFGDDIEFDQIDYMMGLLVCKGDAYEYHSFIAHRIGEEKKMFEDFCVFMKAQRGFTLYHWGSYERTALAKLAARYGMDSTLRTRIENNMVDLHKLLKKAVAFPTYGNGLKDIAKWLEFSWRHKEVTAMESVAYYLEYVENPTKNKEKLQRIIDYNEDDVRATKHVKDFLVKI
ncbi:TM0106 family RecB-like putative nuclease [Candidatus Woesearchaeota archaeon]|nr:TM0106 family RecB-like putative nuclease [Candidatus Woesearchaeota archaeon]